MDSPASGRKTGAMFTCLLVFLIVPGGAAILHAQRPAGEIRLAVKDPSGAAMKASGRLRNLSAGMEQSFQTDAQGARTFANLPYGRYRLEVSSSGFSTQSVLIDVQSQTPVSRTVVLPLGTAAAQIDVVAT